MSRLGCTRLQIYRHVIIVPAIAKVYPALCSQFVLMMLASSICSAISTHELAASAAFIESQTYRVVRSVHRRHLDLSGACSALRAAWRWSVCGCSAGVSPDGAMTALPEVQA